MVLFDLADDPFPDSGPIHLAPSPFDWETVLDDPYSGWGLDKWGEPEYRPRSIPSDSWDGKTVQDYGDDAADIIARRLVGNYDADRFGVSPLLDVVLRWERSHPGESRRKDIRSLALELLARFLARLSPEHKYHHPEYRELWSYVLDKWALRYVHNKIKTAVLRGVEDPDESEIEDGESNTNLIRDIAEEDSIAAFYRTLPGKYAEIARLAADGEKKADIARRLGIHRNTVGKALRSMRGRAEEFFKVGVHFANGRVNKR